MKYSRMSEEYLGLGVITDPPVLVEERRRCVLIFVINILAAIVLNTNK